MAKLIRHSELDALLAAHCEAPRWYVAFSGGADSTALLQLLNLWCRANSQAPSITAVHVNHGIQAQSSEWENHCDWICRFLDIPFLALAAQVESEGKGLESAAREARYGVFEELLEEGDVLFMGHHQDDQVETFFLRLLRGAGVEGLAAMPGERALGEGLLLRPLLGYSREQLLAYVESQGLRWVDDPSNDDTGLDRNFLRAKVMPQLEQRWPAYRQTVTRAAAHLASVSQTRERDLEVPQVCYSSLGDPGIPLDFIDQASDDQAGQILRHWLKAFDLQPPDQSLLEEFIRQLRDAVATARPQLDSGSYRLQRYRGVVYLLPVLGDLPADSVALAPGETLELDGVGRISLQRSEGEGIWLAADEELRLGWRDGGERCRLAGHKRSKSLKKVLQEGEIPPWWRERVPLLYLQDELLAVGGIGPCHSSRWGEEGQDAEAPWDLVWEPTITTGCD